jgi:hypothetical protein
MPIPDSFTPSRNRAQLSAPRPGRGPSEAVHLAEEIADQVNAGSLDLAAGNALLAAAGLAPLEPGVPADFLMPICLHIDDHTPSTVVTRAKQLLTDDLDELTWTRLAGPARHWHVNRDQAPGSGYATVYAELRLRVTALASLAGEHEPTAFRLLSRDLRLLSEVEVFIPDIRPARPRGHQHQSH